MDVKTGYFAQMNEYEEAGYTCVSISLSQRVPTPFRLPELNPPGDIIKAGLSEAEYTREYLWRVLKDLDCEAIWRNLEHISTKIVLLCFERSDTFCHRHLVASYFTSKGFPIEEYQL